jgi:hypothetical protein
MIVADLGILSDDSMWNIPELCCHIDEMGQELKLGGQ